jgi:hypothetical protein
MGDEKLEICDRGNWTVVVIGAQKKRRVEDLVSSAENEDP